MGSTEVVEVLHEYFESLPSATLLKPESSKLKKSLIHSNVTAQFWLVQATYVVDGGFFGHYFWKLGGNSVQTHEFTYSYHTM